MPAVGHQGAAPGPGVFGKEQAKEGVGSQGCLLQEAAWDVTCRRVVPHSKRASCGLRSVGFGLGKGAGRGASTARANRVWKELLAGYEEPVLDVAVAEALAEYVAKRKAEGGAPMN